MKKSTWFGLLVLMAAIAVILAATTGRTDKESSPESPTSVSKRPARAPRNPGVKKPTTDPEHRPARASTTGTTKQDAVPSSDQESDEEASEPLTEDEKRERAEEALVEAFDALTDKWMESPSEGKSVTMEDVRQFAEQFRKLPKSRQDECLHRALNLVPDENVMLLAGILMDKTLDKEILETVYNDVLNRDEDVKKPILQQIIKDREHPCWADTAWILDITGELPKKNDSNGR